MTTTILKMLSLLYHLNPRWLYLAVLVVLIIPLVVTVPLPANSASRGARGLFDTVGTCPTNKVVLVDSSWSHGAKPECMAQLECIINDLCRRKIKFVMVSMNPYGPMFADSVVKTIISKAGYGYGTNWAHLGFIMPPGGNAGILIQSLCTDIHATRPVDINGTALSNLPLMRSVRSVKDIHLVISISYDPGPDWLSFGRGQFGIPVAFGTAAICGSYYCMFLESGQLCGLLAGNRGAYEYESMSGIRGMGSTVMMAFGFGICFIVIAVLLGNIGFQASSRLRRMQ